MPVDCYTTFDETCGENSPGPYTQAAATGDNASSGWSASDWTSVLGGVFTGVAKLVNPPPPGTVVAGRGIPGSPGSLTPVQQTGIGTLALIAGAVLLVWFVAKR